MFKNQQTNKLICYGRTKGKFSHKICPTPPFIDNGYHIMFNYIKVLMFGADIVDLPVSCSFLGENNSQ